MPFVESVLAISEPCFQETCISRLCNYVNRPAEGIAAKPSGSGAGDYLNLLNRMEVQWQIQVEMPALRI